MTTIYCVKCPDCKSNPKQSPAPAQPSSLELIGLSSWLCQIHLALPAVGGGVAEKSPARPSHLLSPQADAVFLAHLPGPKAHTLLA